MDMKSVMDRVGLAVLPGIGELAKREKHMPERATRRLMAGAVMVVAALAAVVSYLHIQNLVLSHGQGHLAVQSAFESALAA
jgi:hypothetical protein